MIDDKVSCFQPLARQLRPVLLKDFYGQSHLVAEGKPLYKMACEGGVHSMILWGPPGTGKTTLAELLSNHCDARMESLSAVLSGVKDIRAVVQRAQALQEAEGRKTVLFVDEVHRFNKGQQDAFLPHIENGTILFIGATTENPSFHLNNALLSRCRVYVLRLLSDEALEGIVDRALALVIERDQREVRLSSEQKSALIQQSGGDARACLNALEMALDFVEIDDSGQASMSDAVFQSIGSQPAVRMDRQGDCFYDSISAFHKSIRGSDPDAALYWLARMMTGGMDVAYLARRCVRIASEDIGNADPRALDITLNAWNAYERLGSPEGDLALAQAVVYLSVAPKSNAVYSAWSKAQDDAQSDGHWDVPLHLRNAVTSLMTSLDYGKDYRYAHDEREGYSAGQSYFPGEMSSRHYYHPVSRGLEIKIKEKLSYLRQLSQKGGA